MKRIFVAVFAALTVTGCLGTSALDRLLENKTVRRASYDFQCPAGEIRVQKIDVGQYGASGCGRRAAYVAVGRCSSNHTGNQVRVGCQMVSDKTEGRAPKQQ